MDTNECLICSKTFETREKLRKHTEFYKLELRECLRTLHRILAHISPEAKRKYPDGGDMDEPHLNMTGQNNTVEIDGKNQFEPPTDDGKSDGESDDGDGDDGDGSDDHDDSGERVVECPHEDCEGKRKPFSRPQDLTRHYMTHYNCDELCAICSTPYTTALKFTSHKCKPKTRKEREHVKLQRRRLRNSTKAALKRRLIAIKGKSRLRTGDLANPRSEIQPPLKRCKAVDSGNNCGRSVSGLFPPPNTIAAIQLPLDDALSTVQAAQIPLSSGVILNESTTTSSGASNLSHVGHVPCMEPSLLSHNMQGPSKTLSELDSLPQGLAPIWSESLASYGEWASLFPQVMEERHETCGY